MTPSAIALLDALLRASLHGALFAGAVWAVCRLFPGLPASLRCALWWLACLKVLVSLAAVSPVELPLLPAPAPVSTATWIPLGVAAPAAPVSADPTFRFPWEAALAGLWLAGLLVQLGGTLRQLGQARGIVRRSSPVGEPWIAERFAELRRGLGLGERAELRVSDEVEAPQVLGLLRPVVLLPASRALSSPDLSMALCHELVHIRRADLWWGWIPALAQRLMYFHPLVRLAAREYALAREAACDAEVLRVLDPEPQAYGRLLLRLGVAPRASRMAAAGAAPSVQTLKRRLQMLEQSSENRRLPLAWASLIVLLALAAVLPLRMVAQEAPPAPPAVRAPEALPAPPAAEAPEAVPAPPDHVPAVAPVAQVSQVGAVPPAPPSPPAPPAPPAPPRSSGYSWSSDGDSFILLLEKNRTMMNGSMDDIRLAKKLQKGSEPLLYFRRDGKAYVVRDAALVEQAEEIFRPQAELGAKQGELGAKQGELGGKQGELGARQGALGAKQGALGARMGRRGEDDESLAAEMEELAQQQEELARKQEELGRLQEELGRKQEELGRQQERLGRESQKKIRALTDEALRRGLAQEVEG